MSEPGHESEQTEGKHLPRGASSGRDARGPCDVESEAYFQALFEHAPDAIFLSDPTSGEILDANPAACRLLQRQREDLVGRSYLTVHPPESRERSESIFAQAARGGPATAFEHTLMRSDGSRVPVKVSVRMLAVDDRPLLMGIFHDMTESKESEEAARRERQALLKMVALQERERKLVAYEIHDGLAQHLTGAIFRFQAFRQVADPSSDQARGMFDEGLDLLEQGLAEARRLIGGLRPPILDESGVVHALEYVVGDMQQREEVDIELFTDVELHRLASPVETALFRVAQEALTNACRHSGSDRVAVRLEQREDTVRLEVKDWGRGFDPQTVSAKRFGLRGIRERAELLGGWAHIDSTPGTGTRITVELPLIEPATGDAEGLPAAPR